MHGQKYIKFIDTPNCVLEDPNSNYVIMAGD